uniref:Gag-pol polyprotein n=1 Tax=Syphacia muris TaxID=451379 RepID=A0A0N5B038_9BILA
MMQRAGNNSSTWPKEVEESMAGEACEQCLSKADFRFKFQNYERFYGGQIFITVMGILSDSTDDCAEERNYKKDLRIWK